MKAPERPRSIATVNAALRTAGHAERLARGDGYFYFYGGRAQEWSHSSVFVTRVEHNTIEQWLRERDTLAAKES